MRFPIYLDYMATTPVDPAVVKSMLACLEMSGNFGNPASTSHSLGWKAAETVQLAREQVATVIGAQADEIIWTSGATEANNLAIQGAAHFYRRSGKHIVTSKTEHKAVLDVCEALSSQGYEVTYLSPAADGLISPAQLSAAMREDTVLVSIMQVNNEIGVVQDIKALVDIAHARGALFHMDAAQSIGKLAVDVGAVGVDYASFSAHKAYGPKGIGCLYVKRRPRVRLTPLFYGGGHEQGLRPGTLATHQIVGMATAFQLAASRQTEDQEHILGLKEQLWAGIQRLPKVVLNGSLTHGVPHNLNVGFIGVEGESLMMGLKDLAVSSGSACTSATIEPSHVLLALGLDPELAHASIRFSLGRYTTAAEIDFAIKQVHQVVNRLREMSPLWPDDSTSAV